MKLTNLQGRFGEGVLKRLMISAFLVALFSICGLQAQTSDDLGPSSAAELKQLFMDEIASLEGTAPADRTEVILSFYKRGLDDYFSYDNEFSTSFSLGVNLGQGQAASASMMSSQPPSIIDELPITKEDIVEYESLLSGLNLRAGDVSDVQLIFDYFREIKNR